MQEQEFSRICKELGVYNWTERVALRWLYEERGVSPNALAYTHGGGRPDFVQMTSDGKYGFEVKSLVDSRYITFPRRQYNSLKRWNGEVLVFGEESSPLAVIPFSELPQDGGQVYGVEIHILKSQPAYYTTLATSMDEKIELEKLRGEIETKTSLPQSDWADMLLQAMYAMLCDTALTQFAYANRMDIKHFLVTCPYCEADNTIQGRYRLYWMVECSFCHRRFVAKRRIMKKAVGDFFV